MNPRNVRDGRQNQRPRAGQTPTGYTNDEGASYKTQHGGAHLAPSQQSIPQPMAHNMFYDNSYVQQFGLPDSDIFTSSRSLSHTVPGLAAEDDQTRVQSPLQHIGPYAHDVRDWGNRPGGSHHPYSQPQEEGLQPPPSIASQTGSSGIPRHGTEALTVPRQDVSASSRGHHKTLNLTEAQLHTLDESAKRILKDYAGNNLEARKLLISYLQTVVAYLRGAGQVHWVAQGGKQKEYAVIVPVGEPGPKGGHDRWRCGLCQQDQTGNGRTFQKVVGHFLSEHYHKAHPKPELWVCDQQDCTRGYSGLNELNRHLNSEHGIPMPKRAKEPATTPSPHPSDYSNVSGPSKGARRVKPYPDASKRRQPRVESAAQDVVYPNAQFPFPPASGSHAPTSTRVQRHGSHFSASGGNVYSTQATSQVPQHQSYGAPMPDNVYQLPMGHSGQARVSMPTPTHYSPADMNPPLSPSPSMPVPNVPNSFYWDHNQFNQPYNQQ